MSDINVHNPRVKERFKSIVSLRTGMQRAITEEHDSYGDALQAGLDAADDLLNMSRSQHDMIVTVEKFYVVEAVK